MGSEYILAILIYCLADLPYLFDKFVRFFDRNKKRDENLHLAFNFIPLLVPVLQVCQALRLTVPNLTIPCKWALSGYRDCRYRAVEHRYGL